MQRMFSTARVPDPQLQLRDPGLVQLSRPPKAHPEASN
jgi:hypothetical protein